MLARAAITPRAMLLMLRLRHNMLMPPCRCRLMLLAYHGVTVRVSE